ncbi:MAG: hypothetical protein ACI9LG_002870 [Moritella dasanensis]|jgi:hypothetical protein
MLQVNMSIHQKYHDRLTSALDDLLRCKRYCEVMLELPIGDSFSKERTIYEGLHVASIITYGRIFTTANTEYKQDISNKFGKLRERVLKSLCENESKFHRRIITKRDTNIAHSDANSRNIKHYNNSSLPTSSNPYYPLEHSDVIMLLNILSEFISSIGQEQARVGSYAFENDCFGKLQSAFNK